MFAPFASFAKRNKNGLQQICNIIILYIRQYYTIPFDLFLSKKKNKTKQNKKQKQFSTNYIRVI